jgi:hypothetical protein
MILPPGVRQIAGRTLWNLAPADDAVPPHAFAGAGWAGPDLSAMSAWAAHCGSDRRLSAAIVEVRA